MDTMKVIVLENGTVKIETDAVSPANHRNAEAFLLELARQLGGTTERRQKQGHAHQHGCLIHTH